MNRQLDFERIVANREKEMRKNVTDYMNNLDKRSDPSFSDIGLILRQKDYDEKSTEEQFSDSSLLDTVSMSSERALELFIKKEKEADERFNKEFQKLLKKT